MVSLSDLTDMEVFHPMRWALLVPAAVVFIFLLAGFGMGSSFLTSMLSTLPFQSVVSAFGAGIFAYGLALVMLMVGYAAHDGKEHLFDDLALLFMLFGVAVSIGSYASAQGISWLTMANIQQVGLFSPTTAVVLGSAYLSLALASRIPGPWMGL